MHGTHHHLGATHHKNIDMLHGSLADKILWFAIPLAVTSVLQQLFNAADMAVVGRFVGENAMAAVGSNSYLINLLVNLFVGLSMGTNVVLSQAIGAGNEKGIRKIVHTSLIVAVAGGILMTAFGELAAVHVLRLLSVPEEVLPMSELYLRIYLLGLPILFLYNFEAAIFRAGGDTETPLFLMILSGVINVLLNLFFVCILRMTVEGVAIATVVSNLVSALILFGLLCRREDALRVRIRELQPDIWALRRIFAIGVPSGVQGMMFSLSNISLQTAVNSLGTTVMAATSAAALLEIVAYFVMASFGQACTTFVGQNYGARQPDRCEKVYWRCLGLDYLFTVAACGLILFFVRPLLGIFNSNPEIVRVGTIRLQYVFFAYIFSVIMEVTSGYLRGCGISVFPAVTALISVCGLRILWVFLVFPHFHTYQAIVIAYPISLFVNAVLLLVGRAVYRRKQFLA